MALFLTTWVLTGASALAGSMVGHYFGPKALLAGAMAGGIFGVLLSAQIARAKSWIAQNALARVFVGGSIAFLAAAFLAVKNAHTPVVPLLSTLLPPIGALAAARIRSRE